MFIHPSFRRNFLYIWLFLILISMFTLHVSGCSPKKNKVYRVDILSGLDFFADTIDGFKAQMTKLGYIEGENIIYNIQKTIYPAEYQRILEMFVADETDLIFVFPTEAALKAKAITIGTGIPLLFAHSFIEGNSLVDSVRQPGGNITGIRFPGPDFAVKNLETLLEMAPQVNRVWVPYLQGYPSVPSQLESMRQSTASLKITLIEFPATSGIDVQAELQARAQSVDLGLDAILFIDEPLSTWPDVIADVTEFSANYNVPVGNLLLFMQLVDNIQVGGQAATMANKILTGTPAGTIPVASADPFLIINYTAAQKLGLTVPIGLLGQANKVIRN